MAFVLFTFWTDLLLCFSFLFAVLYFWVRHAQSYWKRKGIEGPEASFFVGNMGEIFKLQTTLPEKFEELYIKYKHSPFTGVYMGLRPTLMVNDLDLIKRIMVKDFSYFPDHGFDMNYEHEPLAAHLFNVRGERWKHLRTKLSPTFTTSRMKHMFGTLDLCSKTMLDYLESNHEEVVDVKEVLSKFTTDVIGSCAFGLECNSFKDPNAEFRTYGKKMTDLPVLRALAQFFMFFLLPSLMSKIPFSILGKDINDFFINTVKKTVEYREKNNITRNDFLDLLIQLKNKGEIEGEDPEKSNDHKNDDSRLTMLQLTAQVFVFFFAGYETSSTTGSFALYELALNPEIQRKLIKEIDQVLEKHDGKFTYDSISEMNYLTMVIEETLRKYPPLGALMRLCAKDYKLPESDKIIEKDTPLIIPLYGIQRDPTYFPDPEKFDPERFTAENKENRHHFAYMPFGEGPRICIGNRFGMLQTKLGLASLLSKYEFSTCDKTQIPMSYNRRSLILTSEGGLWLTMNKRNE